MMNAWLKQASLLSVLGLTWIGYWWKAGEVSITGNVHPPVALMDQDVILSCQVGGCSPSSLKVWLYKWGHSEKNALYIHSGPKQDKIQEGSTGERHENGTHRGQFKNGVLEVTLFRVQTADSGQYVCAMTCGRVHKEVTLDVIVTGVLSVAVGEGAILPCHLKETHKFSHWKLWWRRIDPGKIQTIYAYQYLYQETSPMPYSEHIVHNTCSHSNGPSIREWLGKKYEQRAEVFVRNWNGSLKLNNIQKEDEGRYQCSVKSDSFNKTIIFKLSTTEFKDQNTEILKFFCFAFLYFLAFFALFCFAAYIVGHKRHSGIAEEQTNYAGLHKIHKLRRQIEEQKTDAEELRKLRIQVEEQKRDAEELRELRSQVEERNTDAEELRRLRIQVEEQKRDAEELRNLRIQVEEQKYDAADLQKVRIQVELFEAHCYREDVILDPSTAHPRLEVSEDLKSLRDVVNMSNVSNSEERFESHLFVLAKDGFSQGKHYWEVEVGQRNNWGLGVASESVPREGKSTLAPQNGYWVIECDGKKNYWAQTEPLTPLEVSGKPTKIGLFLNMPERCLSFYDVNSRSKLHTYTFSYLGKLYPFFSLGSITAEPDSEPLKITP